MTIKDLFLVLETYTSFEVRRKHIETLILKGKTYMSDISAIEDFPVSFIKIRNEGVVIYV